MRNNTVKTYGLILSEANSGDSDKVLTILTSNMGKITAFAKGARRVKSPLLASTQVFSFSKFLLFEGRNMYYINSAEIVDVFYDLRFSYSKMEIGFKILKILRSVSPENLEVFSYLSLAVNTLSYISKTNKDPEFIFNIFLCRLLFEMGVGLDLEESKEKSEKEKNDKNEIKDDIEEKKKFAIYFEGFGKLKEYRNVSQKEYTNLRQGINKITEKENDLNRKYILNINVFSSIKYIYTSKIEKIFNFNLEKEVIEEFNILMQKGFKRHINIKI